MKHIGTTYKESANNYVPVILREDGEMWRSSHQTYPTKKQALEKADSDASLIQHIHDNIPY